MLPDYTPEDGDFTFNHNNDTYCIGLQRYCIGGLDVPIDVISCSVKSYDFVWSCFYTLQVFPEMRGFDYCKSLSTFLYRLNTQIHSGDWLQIPHPDWTYELLSRREDTASLNNTLVYDNVCGCVDVVV